MGLQVVGVRVSTPGADATGAPAAAPAAPVLAAVLDKIRAKADYGPNEPRNPVEPPKPKTVEIKADDAMVRRMAKLEGEALASKETIARLETTAKQAETLFKVQELYAAGKRSEALGLLSKADPSEEMEKLLEEHLSRPTEETETALADKVDELQKRLDADEAARKDQETKQAARAESDAKASTLAFATHALDAATNDDGTPKFELCARPKNREGAAQLAIEHAVALAIKRSIDVDSLTPDATRALLQDAYADVEAELEAEGIERQREVAERYVRTPKAQPAARQPLFTQTPAQRPTAQQVDPPGNWEDQGRQDGQQTSRPQPIPKPGLRTEKPLPAHTLEAVLAKNRQRARY